MARQPDGPASRLNRNRVSSRGQLSGSAGLHAEGSAGLGPNTLGNRRGCHGYRLGGRERC